VVVVAGGGSPPPDIVAVLPPGAPVVAADSGADTALALGLVVDVVVGDLDSVTPSGLAAAQAAGARIVRHPEAKDATDLALAIEEAATLLGEGGGAVVVLGGHGGRLDHLLAGILALADDTWAGLSIRAHLGPATVHVVHGPGERDLGGAEGDLVTLVPVGGTAEGVRTTGLRYPLRDEPLGPGTTRGVSNLIESLPARVALRAGVLLAVLPGDEPNGGHL
jgi:thiamine pyrophosphokinase